MRHGWIVNRLKEANQRKTWIVSEKPRTTIKIDLLKTETVSVVFIHRQHLSIADKLELTKLFPYLTWDCPLNDNDYASLTARIRISYVGKQRILIGGVACINKAHHKLQINNNDNYSSNLAMNRVTFEQKC